MSKTNDLVQQIAKALDVREEELRAFGSIGPERLAAIRQRAELLEGFLEIEDRQARQRCVNYVRSEAEWSRRQAEA